ncbi:6-carboxytetrahydropterin synthase QueD [Paenirhodobacter sp.]|uniref:6-carboxytetrahydropterin synthase QueD n=1 Tax=Paenirhodobacter sp. TaxID=1965326 RepID=UPI003B420252
MFRISKEFHFSASHRLDHLPATHQCHRLHGHNYIVVVELAAETLSPDGFVRDYHDLAELKAHIDAAFDHRHLNDILPIPTAEHIARYFYDWAVARWPEVTAVKVSETPKTWAEYRP